MHERINRRDAERGRRSLDAATVAGTGRAGDWAPGNRYETLQRTQLGIVHSSARTAGVTVLTGDFNVPAPSVLYPRVTDDGAWSDPFAATDPPTFQQAFLPPDRRASRID